MDTNDSDVVKAFIEKIEIKVNLKHNTQGKENLNK